MVEMIWKEPPPAVSAEKAEILAELQKNPGRWAMVQTRYKSTSATAPWKKLGCEAVYRRSEPNELSGKTLEYDIYARWPEQPTAPSKSNTVEKAISTGTALTPPPPAVPRKGPTPAANDMGLNKFLEQRRARGAV